MKFWAWGAMVVAVGAIGSTLGACGGSSSTGGGGAGGAASASSSSASSSSVSSTTSTSSGGVKGSECKAQGTMCAPCCQMDFKTENDVLFGKYVVPMCACNPAPDGGMPPVCAMACANTACKMMPLDQTCADCINNMVIKAQNKCFADSLMACEGDATCKAVVDCVNTNCM